MKNRLLKFRCPKSASSLVSLLCALLAATSASAQDWTGGGDGVFWNNALNWTSLPISGTTTIINFNNASAINTAQNLGNPFVFNQLQQNSAGTINISGNSLEMAGSNPNLYIAAAGSTIYSPFVLSGTGFNQIGGNDLTLAGGTSGTGQFLINGGHVTISSNNSSTLAGGTVSAGTLSLHNTTVTGPIINDGTVTSNGSTFTGNISGNGNYFASGSNELLGINSYTGGSTVVGTVEGTTNSIQGDWFLDGGELVFSQNSSGTMSGDISGTDGYVELAGDAQITLTGNNSFTGGINVGNGVTFGIGSNTAAGIGATIWMSDGAKLKAEGDHRTVANPLEISDGGSTEIVGSNNLTFTDATGKILYENSTLIHNSTGTSAIGGTFLGQNTSQIDVNSGTLKLGAAVNNGFRMDGAINVSAGATLEMISNSFVKLGATNLNGGTLVAANGVAIPTGVALNAYGTISGRVASEAGSVIDATGPLSMGDSQSFAGFFSNGELRENAEGVTIMDKNQAVMGSLTTVGLSGVVGTLTVANGMFVDFGRAIEGYGTVASGNTLAQATIINGNAAGFSGTEMLDFSGYVKGVGTFTDVSFSGTFSPGLSPAIVSVGSSGMANSSTLIMEIGGLTPGSQHDQIDIGGIFALAGLLDVDLINGFNPSLGDSFHILDGNTTGSFSGFSLPTIDPGLTWDTSDLYTDGYLKIAAIPEPGTCALVLVGLAAVMRRRRAEG